MKRIVMVSVVFLTACGSGMNPVSPKTVKQGTSPDTTTTFVPIHGKPAVDCVDPKNPLVIIPCP